jgi:hypothetical protein
MEEKPRFSAKRIISAASGCVVLAALVGTIFTLDDRWAKAAEVKRVELRLDQKILNDRIDRLQERIWKLEDRYGGPAKIRDPAVLEEYRKLNRDKNEAEGQLNLPKSK